MRKFVFCLFVLSVFITSNAYAEYEDWHFKKGDSVMSIAGSFSYINSKLDGWDIRTTTIGASYGYFVSKEIEISIKGSGIWADADEIDLSLGGAGADIKYNCHMKGFTPYLGAQYLFLWGNLNISDYDKDIKGSLYGPLAGLKYFLTESTILTIEYQYQLFAGDDIDTYLENSSLVSIGISFRF